MTSYGHRQSSIFLLTDCAFSTMLKTRASKGAEMNIELFTKVLSDILSEKYGVRVKIKAERKIENGKR